MNRHKSQPHYILVHLPLYQSHNLLDYRQVIYEKLQFKARGVNNSITKIQTPTLTKFDPCGLQEEKNVEARTHTPTQHCHPSSAERNTPFEYGQGIASAERSPLSG